MLRSFWATLKIYSRNGPPDPPRPQIYICHIFSWIFCRKSVFLRPKSLYFKIKKSVRFLVLRFVILWFYGLWFYGFMVLWFYSFMVLGFVVHWFQRILKIHFALSQEDMDIISNIFKILFNGSS